MTISNGIMNGDISTDGSNILEPGKDNNGGNVNFSKTSSGKCMRDHIEEFLSINSKTNGRLFLSSKFFNTESDAKISMHRLALRNTSNRRGMNISASMGAKSEKRLGPDSVSHRCNRKWPKIL